MMLSDDYETCTRCCVKLDYGVCNCCGSGFKHVCFKYMTKSSCQGWALGNNKGCDEHIQIGDVMFPPDYGKCEHRLAEEKAREVGW